MSMNGFFYELKHDIGADYFTVEEGRDLSFPLHMHRCYEIILLLEGSMKVCVEEDEYVIGAGDMILIKPNRVHSLETETSSRHKLCIFSPELIAAVSSQIIKYRLQSPVLPQVPSLYRELFEGMDKQAGIARIKGFLYSICDLFCSSLDFSREDVSSGKHHLIRDVFLYVEENMSSPCSLASAADALGYSASYLSRVFNAMVGMPYTAYVQQVKISHACYLLRNTDHSITEIVSRCGYASVITFNHSFRQVIGCNPTAYRKEHRS